VTVGKMGQITWTSKSDSTYCLKSSAHALRGSAHTCTQPSTPWVLTMTVRSIAASAKPIGVMMP